MKMRCFCLCLKLCLDLSWFEFGKIYVRVMAFKCHVGDQSKLKKHVLAEQHVPKSAKSVCILTMLAGPKKVCERLSARTRLAVLARNRFPTKHQFKHTTFQKDQLCTDTCFCILNKTWTRSKLKKVVPQRWPRRYAALSECRNATTFCHSQHANA